MTLTGTTSGTGSGTIAGLGAYEPGSTVGITAIPGGSSIFIAWTGNAPYTNTLTATRRARAPRGRATISATAGR